MKTGFDRFMEIYGRYEQLNDEERYDEAEELGKKISQIILRVHEAMVTMSEDDYRAFFVFDELQRYASDRMISYIASNENYSTECCDVLYKEQLKVLEETFGKKTIREYVMSRAQNHKKHYKECLNDLARKFGKNTIRKYAKYMTKDKSIQMDTIITDMFIANNITIFSKAKLKCIKDNWGGFFVKYIEGEDIDPITHYHFRHKMKFMSDVLNYMEVNIDYDNDLFNVEKAE